MSHGWPAVEGACHGWRDRLTLSLLSECQTRNGRVNDLTRPPLSRLSVKTMQLDWLERYVVVTRWNRSRASRLTSGLLLGHRNLRSSGVAALILQLL